MELTFHSENSYLVNWVCYQPKDLKMSLIVGGMARFQVWAPLFPVVL